MNLTAATSAVLICVAAPAGSAQAHAFQTYLLLGESPKVALHRTGIGWVDAQLDRVVALPHDWDGYGAEPIDIERLNSLAAVLESHLPKNFEPGSIVPGADGSVQAEWHLLRSSFGYLIDHEGNSSAWVRPVGEPEIERFGLEASGLLKWATFDAIA